MGKLIKTLCGLIFLLFSTPSIASPEGMAKYPWTMMNIPVWCGPVKQVNDALEKEGYVAVEAAFGRVKSLPDGQIVYMVTTYASTDLEGNIIRTLETPEQIDKCILNMLFDYKAIVPKTGV